ncbi:hypothetical protein CMT41_01755 [Colwellia sp. MT41]|uniref:Uncharacterized protein n=1 Tax=Colwellia marinimaniae TaxID=1513592 RepID=A0ABQ0MZ65_9GAMM|nr:MULTISPECIES: hypothetical protein [Colwellia]ALO33577.1 hypothetical protein CMT41_01755 [Colwellia sp. MT41]GAW97552.1 hypothetical protein MTCD1_03180 [Colwellia marinimaniae]
MNKAKLSQDENLSFKVSHQLLPQEYQRIDLYFSLPVEMGINPSTLNEEEFFYSNIKNQSAYYADKLHLPLVRSRFISQNKGEQSDYRLNLNLYCYQVSKALDADIKQTLKLKTAEEFYPAAIELAEQTQLLTKKLRRYTPSDNKLISFFENADNYLSWHIEQSFLKLLTLGPKSSEFTLERESLLSLCKAESSYRVDNKYNSQVTLDDANRITNKMRLLQRLIEYGVVFQRQTRYLNVNLKRLVRGVITAVIMAFVMVLVLNARSNFTEVTVALVAFLGLIYGLRETFKEDLTSLIWRKIQKGRPKWQNMFTHSVTKKRILSQILWLEYISSKDLPKSVNALFQQRRQQNKQAAQLLHFRCDNKVMAKEFLPGYGEIQLQTFFNLTPFVRFLKKGAGRLYTLDGQKISSQGVERRYQINLILRHLSQGEESLQRFKITLNRSEIVNIELIE